MAEWKTCTRLPAARMPAVAIFPQPNFSAARAANNIIFRIPTPIFGVGLIENLDDSTLLNNQAANLNNSLGISGTFNHNGNDGTIARFGWKAQNKSLHLFAGEAYNVEMGVTNELFPKNVRHLKRTSRRTGLPTNCLNLAGPVTRKTRPTQRRRRTQRCSTTSRRLPTSCVSWLRRRLAR